jgi:hypothetical protein
LGFVIFRSIPNLKVTGVNKKPMKMEILQCEGKLKRGGFHTWKPKQMDESRGETNSPGGLCVLEKGYARIGAYNLLKG